MEKSTLNISHSINDLVGASEEDSQLLPQAARSGQANRTSSHAKQEQASSEDRAQLILLATLAVAFLCIVIMAVWLISIKKPKSRPIEHEDTTQDWRAEVEMQPAPVPPLPSPTKESLVAQAKRKAFELFSSPNATGKERIGGGAKQVKQEAITVRSILEEIQKITQKEGRPPTIEDLQAQFHLEDLTDKEAILFNSKLLLFRTAYSSKLDLELARTIFTFLVNRPIFKAFAEAFLRRRDSLRDCMTSHLTRPWHKSLHFIFRSHQAYLLKQIGQSTQLTLTVGPKTVIRVLQDLGKNILPDSSLERIHEYRSTSGTPFAFEFTEGMEVPNYVFFHKASYCDKPITVREEKSASALRLTDQYFFLADIISQANSLKKPDAIIYIILAGCNSLLTEPFGGVFRGFDGEACDLDIELRVPQSETSVNQSPLDRRDHVGDSPLLKSSLNLTQELSKVSLPQQRSLVYKPVCKLPLSRLESGMEQNEVFFFDQRQQPPHQISSLLEKLERKEDWPLTHIPQSSSLVDVQPTLQMILESPQKKPEDFSATVDFRRRANDFQ